MMKKILLLVSCLITLFAYGQQKRAVILDADTGNEVDDLFAVVRVLIESEWDVLALNATHWQTSHWAEAQSMENSHRLNQLLAGHLGVNVKTRRGGVARMYDWGDLAQHSAAAYEIIQQAKQMPEGQKLTVIALGALTNVASAMYIDPSIQSRIQLYWLGSSYDFGKGIFRHVDFNCMMDIRALDIVLNSEVECFIIPVNVAQEMTFSYEEMNARIGSLHPLGEFLVDRWYNHLDGSRKERVIWDLALIEAMIHPEWAKTVEITTSRHDGNKRITYYQSIDADNMREEFYEKLIEYLQK